jgi:hypothetical protein
MEGRDRWGWRQNLTWKSGFGRAQAGRPYSAPWWADRRVYGLAYLHGKDVPVSEELEAPPPQPRALPDALPLEGLPQESTEAEWERLMRDLSDLSR